MQVVILDYGAGNIFSVQKAFERLGIETQLSHDKAVIEKASHVVFPGVGHAESAMKQLKISGLDEFIPNLKQPVLGICLGMQLMCEQTDEGNTAGLGIFRAKVREFSNQTSVPHMGWNDVQFENHIQGLHPFYFVHSFKADICEDTWAICDYQEPFSAAMQRNNFFGTQFHPEKSGEKGEEILTYFLKQ